jgi:tRNA-binding protein
LSDPVPPPLTRVDLACFEQIDIRAGTVIEAEPFPKGRKPATKFRIGFGPGAVVRQSSAQRVRHDPPGALVGTDVLVVVNLPPRRISGFSSQVLTQGVLAGTTPATLCQFARPTRDQRTAAGLSRRGPSETQEVTSTLG